MTTPSPTLYEWAGGDPALNRLTQVFYKRVRADPILAPVFAQMS
jgi:hemoglobin